MTPEQTDNIIEQRRQCGTPNWLLFFYREHLIRGKEEFLYTDGNVPKNYIKILVCSDRARRELRPMIAKLRMKGIIVDGWD